MSVRDFLDREPFHTIALAAFVEQAVAEGGWPDAEAARRRAYAYYEHELRAKGTHSAPDDAPAYPASVR